MQLLTYPKTDYMLDSSLETLHAESQEWLKEIDFWSDEITFFYKLIHRRESRSTFSTKELASLEKELIHISSDKLDKAKNEIQNHERSLAAVLKATSLTQEESYRSSHAKLLMEVYEIHVVIRDFKKKVFDFFKNYG